MTHLKLVADYLDTLQPYQPGRPIEEVQRELGLLHVIKLASNENPLGPSPRAMVAAAQVMAQLHLYPDAAAFHLKAALVQALSSTLSVNANQLVIGNGSDELLKLLLQVVRRDLSLQENIVMAWPSFIAYDISARALGYQVRRTPMRLTERGYQYDAAALLAAVDHNTRALFIAQPDNPTATFMPRETLLDLARQLPAHVVLVIDDAYTHYAAGTEGYISGLEALAELSAQGGLPNLFVLRTFSKAYGLAGLRVGYGVGDAQIVDYMNRIRVPFNINTLGLIAAQAALQDEAHLQATLTLNRQEMPKVVAALQARGFEAYPSATNFVLVGLKTQAAPIYEALLREGIITRPLLPYGLTQALRITIGTAEENSALIHALQRLG